MASPERKVAALEDTVGVTEDSNNAESESAEKLTSTTMETAVISTHPEPFTAAATAPMKNSVVSYLGHALGLVYALNNNPEK